VGARPTAVDADDRSIVVSDLAAEPWFGLGDD
jgi:hypothetical protein